MSGSTPLPRARVEGLITTETASDLLIYDTERNELHTLNALAAAVWRAADGRRSVLDLALELSLDPGVVEESLGKLSSAELLTGYSAEQNAAPKASRRRMLKTAVAGVVIVSVSAPMVAAAHSHCPGAVFVAGCTTVGQACYTGNSVNSQCGCCETISGGSGWNCNNSCP